MKALGFKPFLDARDPGADHRHLPRAGRPGATNSSASTTAAKARGFILYPGQADAGRDLPRRLHRRDRPQRDAAGGRRGRRRAAARWASPAARRAALSAKHATDNRAMTTPTPEHPALAAVRKSGSNKVKVAVQRHRRHPARQVPAHRQVPRRRRAAPAAASASATWSSAGTRPTRPTTTRTLTGWQHGFPDALARLDLDTQRHVPWDGSVPFFLGEFVNADGTPLADLPAPDPEARARSAPRSSASR